MKTSKALFHSQRNNLPLSIISIVFLAAIFVCILCNYAIQNTISWSLYPAAGLLFIWCSLFPLFKFKRHRVFSSAAIFSILLIPLLFSIEWIAPGGNWVVPLGIPVAIAGILYVWAVAFLLLKGRLHLWYKISLAVLLVIPLTLFINMRVDSYLQQPYDSLNLIVNAVSCVAVSLICYFIGLMSKKNQ